MLSTFVEEATVETDEAVEEEYEAEDISDTFVSSDSSEALRGRLFLLLDSDLPDLLDIFGLQN